MPYQINFYDEAENDIFYIKEWYQIQSAGLQNKFIDSLEEAIKKLENYPTAFSIKFNQVRTVLLNVFPYKIYFRILRNDIIVIAVIHNKRDRKVVMKRIKNNII